MAQKQLTEFKKQQANNGISSFKREHIVDKIKAWSNEGEVLTKEDFETFKEYNSIWNWHIKEWEFAEKCFFQFYSKEN